MAILNIGTEINEQACRAANMQLIATLDLLKAREQALSNFYGSLADTDLTTLGFSTAEVTAIRNAMKSLDTLVSQGLADPNVSTFTNAGRNFGL